MARRAALLGVLVTAATLLVAPIALSLGMHHGRQEYTEEIERLRRDLLATRDQTGVYLAPDNYDKMVAQLEEQAREIVEKVNHIRALENENDKKQAIFNDMKTSLEQKTNALIDTTKLLENTKQSLEHTSAQRDEQAHLVERRAETERQLAGQASQLLSTVNDAAADLARVHDKLDRKRSLEERNEAVKRDFSAQFSGDMSRLSAVLQTAFQQQRDFCAGLYTELGATIERRKHEASALTALISALLGSQTEQLRDLEAHAQTAAGDAHAWVAGELAAVAARRQAQTQTQQTLQQRLADGADAVLLRLARQDAALVAAAADQRRWLEHHDQALNEVLQEMAALVEAREAQRQQEMASMQEEFEEEVQRLTDSHESQSELIKSLQTSLAAVGTALTASTQTAQALSAAADGQAAAGRGALALRQTRLQQTRRDAAVFQTSADQLLQRARGQREGDAEALRQLHTQADVQVSLQTAEAREQLESARAAWRPALSELSAGWDEHCRRQEAALRARSETVNGQLQHGQQRMQNLAGSLHAAIRGADEQLEAHSRGFFATMRERQQELSERCGGLERQADSVAEMVGARQAQVEVFVESLQRDPATGATPRRRALSYPRYLAATSPHERILARYRRRVQSRQEDEARQLEEAENTPLPADSEVTEVTESDAESGGRELRPAATATPVSDVETASDISDLENKVPAPPRHDQFPVPGTKRQHRRVLRQPKMAAPPRQSPRKEAQVLTARNE